VELERHESEAYLDRLQEGYRQIGSLLAKRHKVDLVEFDVMDEPLDSLVGAIEDICRARMEPGVEPEPELEPETEPTPTG
jgi:hypothetical protein